VCVRVRITDVVDRHPAYCQVVGLAGKFGSRPMTIIESEIFVHPSIRSKHYISCAITVYRALPKIAAKQRLCCPLTFDVRLQG
jgi:hypothetical protein